MPRGAPSQGHGNLLGNCFCARRTVGGQHADRRRGVRGSAAVSTGIAAMDCRVYPSLKRNQPCQRSANFTESESLSASRNPIIPALTSTPGMPSSRSSAVRQSFRAALRTAANDRKTKPAGKLFLRTPHRGRPARGSASGIEGGLIMLECIRLANPG